MCHASKITDEYFAFMEECKDPKACTIMLRGASKDVLNEIERNLLDAMSVVRNIVFDPRIVPGGGATEMAISAVSHTRAHAERSAAHRTSVSSPPLLFLPLLLFLMKTFHARRMKPLWQCKETSWPSTIHSEGT